ncbi:hypothetical protein CR513_14527, partial [Mucuna pruriens]
MKRMLLEKFFPASKIASIRKEICGIRQHSGEILYEYMERFNKLCATCPHHQINEQFSGNSSHVTNTSDSVEYSSGNNFVESEQMENNDQTLNVLATPDVMYQPWCIQYPQLELAQ